MCGSSSCSCDGSGADEQEDRVREGNRAVEVNENTPEASVDGGDLKKRGRPINAGERDGQLRGGLVRVSDMERHRIATVCRGVPSGVVVSCAPVRAGRESHRPITSCVAGTPIL